MSHSVSQADSPTQAITSPRSVSGPMLLADYYFNMHK